MGNRYLEKIASNRYVKELFRSSKKWEYTPTWHTDTERHISSRMGDVKYQSLFGESLSGNKDIPGFLGTGMANVAEGDILNKRLAGNKGKIVLQGKVGDKAWAPDILSHLRKKISLPK